MKIYRYPKRKLWGEITSRPRLDLTKLNETVAQVLSDVRQRGDEAVKEYELKFDKATLETLAVSEQEMQEAERLAQSKAKPFEKTFLNAVPAYLVALDISCQKLSAASQWKQDMLLKRIHKDVKFRRDVSEWSQILKEYEEAQGNLVRAGAIVQMGWGEVVQNLNQ